MCVHNVSLQKFSAYELQMFCPNGSEAVISDDISFLSLHHLPNHLVNVLTKGHRHGSRPGTIACDICETNKVNREIYGTLRVRCDVQRHGPLRWSAGRVRTSCRSQLARSKLRSLALTSPSTLRSTAGIGQTELSHPHIPRSSAISAASTAPEWSMSPWQRTARSNTGRVTPLIIADPTQSPQRFTPRSLPTATP